MFQNNCRMLVAPMSKVREICTWLGVVQQFQFKINPDSSQIRVQDSRGNVVFAAFGLDAFLSTDDPSKFLIPIFVTDTEEMQWGTPRTLQDDLLEIIAE